MWSMFKLKIWRRISLVIVCFTVIASAVLVFISIRSIKLDEQHLSSIECLKNIDVEISHGRIFLDDYYLFRDTLKAKDVLKSIKKSNVYISVLDSFFVETYSGEKEKVLLGALGAVKLKAGRLSEAISSRISSGNKDLDVVILEKHNAFLDSYKELDKYIHRYIAGDNISFKRSIFTLIFFVFSLLIVSLLLIHNFIRAHDEAEKQQAARAIEIEYKERKRIAADLHDGLGSILSAIALYVKLAEKGNEGDVVKTSLSEVKKLSNVALENLEAVINNLSPSNLDKHGLVYCLERICERINEMGGLKGKIIAPESDLQCSPNLKVNLYRICNELINNTIKHSGATGFEIEIIKHKKSMDLVYRDNGAGFDTGLMHLGREEQMGLRNIANRVESLGGKLEVASDADKGVEFKFWFKV